jgi:hypothetical protein
LNAYGDVCYNTRNSRVNQKSLRILQDRNEEEYHLPIVLRALDAQTVHQLVSDYAV